MTTVIQLLSFTPQLTNLLIVFVLLIRGKDILLFARDLLTDHKQNLSSRRFIAITSSLVLFHLIGYTAHYDKVFNPLAGWMLLLNTFLCLGLATLPQLMELWNSIKGVIVGVPAAEGAVTLKHTETTTATELSTT